MNITPKGKQKEVLALPSTGHTVVLGTAGSGKTTIALLRAYHLATLPGNKKVLLVTFNGALVEYIKGISDVIPRNLTVENYHKFARGYLHSRGKMPPRNGILNSDSKAYYIENTSEGSSNWVHTAIGRARCLEATEVQSGKYSTVTIQKWQTALGQTFYTKNMRQNCIFTDGNEVPGVLPDQYVSLDKTIIQEESVPDTQKEATRKSVQNACLADRRFILNSTAVMSLLNNPNFKQNITIGKVLKIIHFLMEGKASTPYVAKKFEVSKEFVEIIKSCIQQND